MADEAKVGDHETTVVSLSAERTKQTRRERMIEQGRANWNRYMDRTMASVVEEAVTRRDAARARLQEMETEPWSKVKREAAEELEFWSSKVAFLGAGR